MSDASKREKDKPDKNGPLKFPFWFGASAQMWIEGAGVGDVCTCVYSATPVPDNCAWNDRHNIFFNEAITQKEN